MGKNKFLALVLVFFLCLPGLAQAAEKFRYNDFQSLPVVHDGRIKPLGCMAQILLKQISDLDVSTKEAAPWLMELLFDPQSADIPAIFYVPDANLRYVLDLPKSEAHYYSFKDLDQAFANHSDLILDLRRAEPKTLTDTQQALLALYAKVTYYEQLKGAMTLVLPLRNAPGQSFIDQYPNDPSYSHALLAEGQNNQSFRIIPEQDQFVAPWQELLQKKQASPLLHEWSLAARAYIQNDPAQWNKVSKQIYHDTLEQAHQPLLAFQLKTELLYTKTQPYFYSMLCYGIGLLAAIMFRRKKRLLAFGALVAGLMLQGMGLLARMIILQRPPVSNLYESVGFIGFLLMALGLFFSWRKRDLSLLMPLAFLGVCLHLLGMSLNGEDNSLKVLQAVLDTKFWLATHVVMITSGYALCLLTSVVAHLCLYENLKKPVDLVHTKHFRMAYLFALISFLLISVGTLLGGVWADQSWGRFWGWDPKENGALLIALWLAWLLHGKFSRDISEFWVAMGLAALSLVVSISWIGVNLLGIGLHSYGFISGNALGLAVLFILEGLFFGWCLFWRKLNVPS